MNFYSLIGFTMAISVLGGGLFLSSPNIMLFVDPISAFIVLGGTVAAVSISFQLDKVLYLVKVFFQRVILGKKVKHKEIIADIIRISEKKKKGTALTQMAEEAKDDFLKEALTMYADELVDHKAIKSILNKRCDNLYQNYSSDTEKFKAMGKYPPAFGMMGTTIGMIVLLANLGGNACTLSPAVKILGSRYKR